jgi:NAD(P)-dependent dehydrogenase (short-subunit alcohol dehydrogenase family)
LCHSVFIGPIPDNLVVSRQLHRNHIASVAGTKGNPNASAYSAPKAGVIGFTKSLGKDLTTQGVQVECITSATFESPSWSSFHTARSITCVSKNSMGRRGEAAALTCWLASQECSFSIAATFDTSGGPTTLLIVNFDHLQPHRAD